MALPQPNTVLPKKKASPIPMPTFPGGGQPKTGPVKMPIFGPNSRLNGLTGKTAHPIGSMQDKVQVELGKRGVKGATPEQAAKFKENFKNKYGSNAKFKKDIIARRSLKRGVNLKDTLDKSMSNFNSKKGEKITLKDAMERRRLGKTSKGTARPGAFEKATSSMSDRIRLLAGAKVKS